MLALIIFALLFSNIVAKNEEYMGYKVYNIKFYNQSQQDNLHKLTNNGIEFLRKPCIKYGTIGKAMVPPSLVNWFEEELSAMEIARDVAIDDVYEYLKDKEPKSNRNDESEESAENNQTIFDFDDFYRYDVILDHLYSLQNYYENSTLSLELVHYGVTEENRPLVYVKLTNGEAYNKSVVVIEAGINPREWITIPSALNVVNELLEDGNRRFLDDFTWIIIPVLNPDGYEYTHTNLRLWTKSRSLKSHLGFICPGVNINRNFDIDWLISDSSSSPCSHLYSGIEPFSETETTFIRNLITDYNPLLYISLQNNGNFITFPWRYEKAASGLFRRHYLLGLDMIRDLNGYKLDSGALAFGDRESGTSTDYARLIGVMYTYNIGVEGGGDDGVIVPTSDIRGIVEDVWKAIAVAASGVQLN